MCIRDRKDKGMREQTKEALQEISRGCVEFIGEEYITTLVEKFFTTGERFCVKAGWRQCKISHR